MNYWRNRVLSIGLPLLIFATVIAFLKPIESAWSWLLLTAFVFGYTHFITGAVYQLGALRAKNDRKAINYFWVLVVIGALTGLLVWQMGWLPYFYLLVILLFVVHGILNDVDFIHKYTSYKIDSLIFFLTASVPIFAALLMSMSHRSAFFFPNHDGTISFFIASSAAALSRFEASIIPFDWIIYTLVLTVTVSSLLMIIRGFKTKRLKTSLLSILFITALSFILFKLNPIPYVFVLFMLLTYHLAAWFFLFLERFKDRERDRLPEYLLWHLFIVVPLGLIILWPQFSENTVIKEGFVFLFDMHVYMTVTFAHILTSLLNEPWIKDRFNLL